MVGPMLPDTVRPNVGGLFDDFSLKDASDAFKVGGSIINAFDSPDPRPLPTGGLGAAPGYVQDFYENIYFPQLTALADRPYMGRPMRRAPMPGEAAFDPIFGSYGAADLQDYMDASMVPVTPPMLPQPDQPITDDPGEPSQTTLSDLGDDNYRLLGMLALGNRPDPLRRTHLNDPYANFAGLMGMDKVTNKYMPGFEMSRDDALATIGRHYEKALDPKFNALGNTVEREASKELQDFALLNKAMAYDPTGNFVDILAPLAAGAILAPVGGAIASGVSGAMGGGSFGCLAGRGASTLFNRAAGELY